MPLIASQVLPDARLHLEDLLDPLDLALGLLAVGLERLAELPALGRLGHAWKVLQDLPLRVVDVLESVEEEVVQGFLLGRHGATPCR